ncbi:MAG: hypothetical protein ABI323_12360 [Solirubrobacteraceae bacterium]
MRRLQETLVEPARAAVAERSMSPVEDLRSLLPISLTGRAIPP